MFLYLIKCVSKYTDRAMARKLGQGWPGPAHGQSRNTSIILQVFLAEGHHNTFGINK
jgi:hypothetical protein